MPYPDTTIPCSGFLVKAFFGLWEVPSEDIIVQGLLRIMMGVVSQWVVLLLGFVGRGETYCCLSAIFLTGLW